MTPAAYCNLYKEHLASFINRQDDCCILSQMGHFLKIQEDTLRHTVLQSSEWKVETRIMT